MRVTRLFPQFDRPACALFFNRLASSKAIREEIGRQVDRANAIVSLAEEEKRELTDEEKAEVDAILGSGTKGTDGYKPGKIDQLERDLARAEKLEKLTDQMAQRRTGAPTGEPDPQAAAGPEGAADTSRPLAARVTVPARAAYRHTSLKAFKGEHAESRAYIAGQWALATLGQHPGARQWCDDHGIDIRFRAALSSDANSLGGFVVPAEMEQAVIDLREMYGTFRRDARVVPMASDTKDQPYRKSGLTAYFVGDNAEITASDKAWGNAKLVAKKLGALVKYSSELDEDSVISIADDLADELAYAFAVKEDNCGFNGDGTSTYGGIVGLKGALAAGSIKTAATGNTAFSTLDLADFEGAVGMLPEYGGIRPKWYISKVGYWASMARLVDAAGGNTLADLGNGPQRIFLGYPVEYVQCLPTSTDAAVSTILAYFGDLRLAALLGNRRGMSVQVSDQRYFEYDQIGIKGTERFDITVHSTGDASNAGAVIALKTPAS